MNKSKILLLIALCIAVFTTSAAREKQKQVFMYGVAVSFNDSTVYLTDIQPMDSAVVVGKCHFLYGRDNYSYQLRDYLKEIGCTTPTCATTYALSRKDIEKKFLATRKRYGGGKYSVKHITPTEFKYQLISVDEEVAAEKLKKAEKPKKDKNAPKGGQKPPMGGPGEGPGGGPGGAPGGTPGGQMGGH